MLDSGECAEGSETCCGNMSDKGLLWEVRRGGDLSEKQQLRVELSGRGDMQRGPAAKMSVRPLSSRS